MSPEDLRPFIAGQAAKVGQGRSSLAEIAAILERGAYSAQAMSRIEEHVRAAMPEPAVDRARIASLEREEADLAAAGYSRAELARHPERARRHAVAREVFGQDSPHLDLAYQTAGQRGNQFDQLAEVIRDLDAATAALDRYGAAVEEAVARWYVEHGEALHAIAVEEAARLKAGRYPETARFLALSRALRLSKPATAALCGVTEDAVAKWRNGSSRPSAAVLRLLEIEAERAQRLGGEQSAGAGEG